MLDAHCHLDLFPNPHRILDEITKNNITVVAVTNLPSHFVQGRPHVASAKTVRLALGLHPLFVTKHTQTELRKFRELASTTSYIGEVGLDMSREGQASGDKQRTHFRYVLEIISNRPRFLSIHSRRAESEVLELLAEYSISKAIFHWYSGPKSLVDSIVNAGHYFSVNPAMIRSKTGRALIEAIPRERILTETDGPFVQIEDRPANPSDVQSVLTHLAAAWSMSTEDTARLVWDNFQTVLQPIKQWQARNSRE